MGTWLLLVRWIGGTHVGETFRDFDSVRDNLKGIVKVLAQLR